MEEVAYRRDSKLLEITFRDLCFSVPTAAGPKQILSHVSGQCQPACVTAIMGASGAGGDLLADPKALWLAESRLPPARLSRGPKS